MAEIVAYAASVFSHKGPTPYTETSIGVYSTCDAPLTELNQVGITLAQNDPIGQRGWLTASLDKESAIALALLILQKAMTIADNAPKPDLRAYSWNLLRNAPNYTAEDAR